MKFDYNGVEYDVEIIKKKNKNTYVRVKDGKIYVTTGCFTTQRMIRHLLEENAKRIGKMLELDQVRQQKKELFLLFGTYYDVVYGEFLKQLEIDDEAHVIRVVSEQVLVKWLDKYIQATFYSHLKYWQRLFEENIPDPDLKIRKMTTRWGVCNVKKKTVTLNLELFRYDMDCLDYVIVHELSHFLVQNHSKQFWKVVEKYYPNYHEARKKLKN